MKKVFLVVTIVATAFVQNIFAQDKTTEPSQLLQSYLSIKNALVSGNSIEASSQASEFVKAANSVDAKKINEAARKALLKDANRISMSKDIKQQRQDFIKFSDNMIFFVKANMFDKQPVYVQYCPMKKAYWLSSEEAIKNPYYGSAMLTCGRVEETIK